MTIDVYSGCDCCGFGFHRYGEEIPMHIWRFGPISVFSGILYIEKLSAQDLTFTGEAYPNVDLRALSGDFPSIYYNTDKEHFLCVNYDNDPGATQGHYKFRKCDYDGSVLLEVSNPGTPYRELGLVSLDGWRGNAGVGLGFNHAESQQFIVAGPWWDYQSGSGSSIEAFIHARVFKHDSAGGVLWMAQKDFALPAYITDQAAGGAGFTVTNSLVSKAGNVHLAGNLNMSSRVVISGSTVTRTFIGPFHVQYDSGGSLAWEDISDWTAHPAFQALDVPNSCRFLESGTLFSIYQQTTAGTSTSPGTKQIVGHDSGGSEIFNYTYAGFGTPTTQGMGISRYEPYHNKMYVARSGGYLERYSGPLLDTIDWSVPITPTPTQLAIDYFGNVYALGGSPPRIKKYSAHDGSLLATSGGPVSGSSISGIFVPPGATPHFT